MNFVVDDPTAESVAQSRAFQLTLPARSITVRGSPSRPLCDVVLYGFHLWHGKTARFNPSTMRRDSTRDCSKSCKFNHFRLVVLNMRHVAIVLSRGPGRGYDALVNENI